MPPTRQCLWKVHLRLWALTGLAVQSYLASEVLSQSDAWFCPNCKSHVQAKKALELWRLPEVLVVHLKRFSYSVLGYYSTTSHKLDSLVDFPLQVHTTRCAHSKVTKQNTRRTSNIRMVRAAAHAVVARACAASGAWHRPRDATAVC